jgi:hypothetical protein
MSLPRFARKDEWRFCGHCEECGDEAISISLTFAIGSNNYFGFLPQEIFNCKIKELAVVLPCGLFQCCAGKSDR